MAYLRVDYFKYQGYLLLPVSEHLGFFTDILSFKQ